MSEVVSKMGNCVHCGLLEYLVRSDIPYCRVCFNIVCQGDFDKALTFLSALSSEVGLMDKHMIAFSKPDKSERTFKRKKDVI